MLDGSVRGSITVVVLIGLLVWAPCAWAEELGTIDTAAYLASQSPLLSVASDDGGSGSDAASYWEDHFSLHGYLTTAYADASFDDNATGPSSEEVIIGIPEDGTWEYRIAALQLRYDPHPKHTFLVQLAHRKFDDSPLETADDDINLDWAFYQYRFTDHSSLRLGRFAVPQGIFNEIRDVGVILPFFRPSYNFYREGGFVSETIDGISLSHQFNSDGDWSLDADVYYGEYTLLEQGTNLAGDQEAEEVDVEDAYGFQVWLNTPVPGLRFGGGYQEYTVIGSLNGGSDLNLADSDWETWLVSADGNFDRWVARAEFKRIKFPINNPSFPDGEAEIDAYYFQLGFHITPQLSIYAQSEYSDGRQSAPILFEDEDFNQRQDDGISLVYAFRPDIVLKAEYHETSYDLGSAALVFPPTGGFLVDIILEELESEYSIISLSLSF